MGGELVKTLNEMIVDLIKENRKLRRQVDRLTGRGSALANSAVDRGLRSIQRRVQKALLGTNRRKRRRVTAKPANGRRTKTRRRATKSTTSP